MLDLAILGLLEERGDLHGYELRKQLLDGLGLLANVSYGSLYPALARLEAAGAVEAVEPFEPSAASLRHADPVPPTGSLTGEWAVLRARRLSSRRESGRGRRSRKIYRITPGGRELFATLLAGGGPADDPRSFGLRLAFARHLPAPARLSLLERRRSQLLQRLDEVRAASNAQSLDVYARSVVDHTADAVEHDIRWLDRLIEVERAAGPQSAGGPSRVQRLGDGAEPHVAAAGLASRRRHGHEGTEQGDNR